MAQTGRVCVGQIVAAHGVRGLVRIKSFTEDPAAVIAYGPVGDESGRRQFRLRLQSRTGDDCWLARIDEVADRTAAEALRGCLLFVDRASLPEPDEEEFYHADLVAVQDFGGGTFLELRLAADGRNVAVPFTRAVVPVIDRAAGLVLIDVPEGLLDPPEPPRGGEDGDDGADSGAEAEESEG
jgi:16S rRNA processing protein RimM